MTREIVAVVLAGGAARRFGTDKLATDVAGRPLLDRALEGWPAQAGVVVVGPQRVTGRPVRFVQESPPGGGPAAALVAGLRAALTEPVEAIAVFPADTPHGGQSALVLLDRLGGDREATAVVGADAQGAEQPLQLALRPAAARALIAAAGPAAGAQASARVLLRALDPPAVPHRLTPDQVFDIDTPDQLLAWRLRRSPAVDRVLAALSPLRTSVADRSVVVAVDGPSGAGKSTLAAALALRTGGIVLAGDDFYASALSTLGPVERNRMSDADVAATVIDWSRLRTEALAPLRAGREAHYRPYDWVADDGRLADPRTVPAGDPVILDGVYSARPELADLVDLTVHLAVDPDVRTARLAKRFGSADWAAFWERGEQHYFTYIRPPATFNLHLSVDHY